MLPFSEGAVLEVQQGDVRGVGEGFGAGVVGVEAVACVEVVVDPVGLVRVRDGGGDGDAGAGGGARTSTPVRRWPVPNSSASVGVGAESWLPGAAWPVS